MPQPHYFHGFLPQKKKEQLTVLETFKEQEATIIFYESPHRIQKTIQVMMEVFGESRQAVVCRELTKLHEEYSRGTLEELNRYLKEHTIKGECCLMVSGSTEGAEGIVDPRSLKEQVEALIASGSKPNDSIKEVAKRNQLKKQVVYNEYHEIE